LQIKVGVLALYLCTRDCTLMLGMKLRWRTQKTGLGQSGVPHYCTEDGCEAVATPYETTGEARGGGEGAGEGGGRACKRFNSK
jgi:hypothetical protein